MKILLILSCVFFAGCASGRIHREPEEVKRIFTEMCSPAATVREVKGSAWVKVSTTEESGQFPAQFHATAPSALDIEATNLVGSVEAYIHIQDDHYTIKWTGKESVEEEGTGSWRGIPLQAAVDLFLGRFPCPPLDAPEVKLTSLDNGDVSALVAYPSSPPVTERFEYRFKSWGGKAWPENLKWKKDGPEPEEVEFAFEAPDDATSSPTRVVAHSPLGEVKIRWKERRKVR